MNKFENEWIQQGYKLVCSDCGLVHDMDFRIYKGKIQFRLRPNNRSTGQIRRHMQFVHLAIEGVEGRVKCLPIKKV